MRYTRQECEKAVESARNALTGVVAFTDLECKESLLLWLRDVVLNNCECDDNGAWHICV